MTDRYANMINDGGPERIWIESEGECPYFYHEEELSDVAPPITEYVRADKLEELAAEIEALRAEVERLKPMTAMTMGVGSGDGNLFVHGNYESIKAAQAIVLERDALRVEVDRLTCELMDAITRADKLAEALRELVDVFSKSGMYDEEVFAKARAELEQEERK